MSNDLKERPPVQSEATAKKWKGLQALGCLVNCLAVFILLIAFTVESLVLLGYTVSQGVIGLLAVWFLFSGITIWLIGRVGGWWYHG